MRKGRMGNALVIKTGLVFASLAFWTPSSVVTIYIVAPEGYSTSLLCSIALEVNFIGMAASSSQNSPKCSCVLIRMSPPTVEI